MADYNRPVCRCFVIQGVTGPVPDWKERRKNQRKGDIAMDILRSWKIPSRFRSFLVELL